MKRKTILLISLLILVALSACGGPDQSEAEPMATSEWGVPIESFDDYSAQATQAVESGPSSAEAGYEDSSNNDFGDSSGLDTIGHVFGDGGYTIDAPADWIIADYQDTEFLAAFEAGEEALAQLLLHQGAVELIKNVEPESFLENAGTSILLEPASFDEDVPLRLIIFYADGSDILNFAEYVQGVVRLLRVDWGMDNVNATPLDEDAEPADAENFEVIYAFKYGDSESASIRYYLKYDNDFILLQFTAQRGIIENLGLQYFRDIALSVAPIGE